MGFPPEVVEKHHGFTTTQWPRQHRRLPSWAALEAANNNAVAAQWRNLKLLDFKVLIVAGAGPFFWSISKKGHFQGTKNWSYAEASFATAHAFLMHFYLLWNENMRILVLCWSLCCAVCSPKLLGLSTLLRPCCYLAGREEDATRWNQSLIDHTRTQILDIPWSCQTDTWKRI